MAVDQDNRQEVDLSGTEGSTSCRLSWSTAIQPPPLTDSQGSESVHSGRKALKRDHAAKPRANHYETSMLANIRREVGACQRAAPGNPWVFMRNRRCEGRCWIGAQDLDRRAGTQIGRIEVARLAGQLVRASAPMVGSFRWRRRHARSGRDDDFSGSPQADFVHPVGLQTHVGRVAVDRPHAALLRQFLVVGQVPEAFPEILLEFAGRLPLRVDLGHLALLVDDEAIFGPHGAGENPAKQHERPAPDRVALLDEVVVELDHQGVKIDFLPRQSQLSRGIDRLAGVVNLGEPDRGLQAPLLVLRLSKNLNPRPAVDVLQNLQVGFETLFLLLELENGPFLFADLVLQCQPRLDDQFIRQIDAGGGESDQHHGPDKRPNGEMTAAAHRSLDIDQYFCWPRLCNRVYTSQPPPRTDSCYEIRGNRSTNS